jgi:hypothetical protein
MQRSGGAATHMQQNGAEIKYLVGESVELLHRLPLISYDEVVCGFLSSLSSELLSDVEAKQYPDVISFAYWCRKANIERQKKQFADGHARLGLGVAFHVTPSNVPINVAFSYIFSLLAGNANIVRVPSKDFPQVDIVCRAINKLFSNAKYKTISEMTVFVKYEQNDDITQMFSSQCDARIIWGGDETIRNIRRLAIPERSVEIAFADRYSFCVIEESSILDADAEEIKRLGNSFYNDAYLMDQNACSSPHLVVWLNGCKETAIAKQIFWDSVYETAASKYDFKPVNAVDKYMLLCEDVIELSNISGFIKHGNYIYRVELESLSENMDALRGKYGYFYEYSTQDLNSVAPIVNKKYQTLTYFGLGKSRLLDFVIKNRLSGIDRIVPIGSALDIGVIWDGYDVVGTLSRIIDFK